MINLRASYKGEGRRGRNEAEAEAEAESATPQRRAGCTWLDTSPTALAEHLGVSQASVSHVLNGYRNDQPSPQFRKGLVELTDAATAAKIIDAIPAPVKKKRS